MSDKNNSQKLMEFARLRGISLVTAMALLTPKESDRVVASVSQNNKKDPDKEIIVDDKDKKQLFFDETKPLPEKTTFITDHNDYINKNITPPIQEQQNIAESKPTIDVSNIKDSNPMSDLEVVEMLNNEERNNGVINEGSKVPLRVLYEQSKGEERDSYIEQLESYINDYEVYIDSKESLEQAIEQEKAEGINPEESEYIKEEQNKINLQRKELLDNTGTVLLNKKGYEIYLSSEKLVDMVDENLTKKDIKRESEKVKKEFHDIGVGAFKNINEVGKFYRAERDNPSSKTSENTDEFMKNVYEDVKKDLNTINNEKDREQDNKEKLAKKEMYETLNNKNLQSKSNESIIVQQIKDINSQRY